MQETFLDLLREPWISTIDASETRTKLDLAEVLATLGAGRELEFTALRTHQAQAWYAFLVQLAAMALERAGERTLEHDAERWRAMVGGLAEDDAAFCLVTGDLSRPAFFQAPVPEGTLKKWKSSPSPDFLDVRNTAKNFDVKADGFEATPEPEHWAFALVTLQTMQGFFGRGNYGIARMNGGFGSRAESGLADSLGWSRRFRRDVPILLASIEQRREEHGFATSGGLALGWTLPWSGDKGEELRLPELEPDFLEICRRIRLTREHDRLVVHGAPSQAARVDTGEIAGDLGDAWTLIRVKDSTALTVSESGLTYRLIARLLFTGDYARGAALRFQPQDDGALLASFRVLVRGKGSTGGYHERQILIPKRAVTYLSNEREQFAGQVKKRLELAGDAQRKVLRLALIALVQEPIDRAAGDSYDLKDDRPDPWVRRLDGEIDRVFFDALFADVAELGLDDVEIDARWQRKLFALTRQVFDQGCAALEPPSEKRFRARSVATSLFWAKAREAFPRHFDDTESEGSPALDSSLDSDSHVDSHLDSSEEVHA